MAHRGVQRLWAFSKVMGLVCGFRLALGKGHHFIGELPIEIDFFVEFRVLCLNDIDFDTRFMY